MSMTTTINQLAPDDYDRCTGDTEKVCAEALRREAERAERAEMNDRFRRHAAGDNPSARHHARFLLACNGLLVDGPELFDDLCPRVRGAR